jgi:hypothetical protein
VKFATALAAEKAMKALNGIHTMETGRPALKVTVPNVKVKRNIEQTAPPMNHAAGAFGGGYGGMNTGVLGMGNAGYGGNQGAGQTGQSPFKLFVGGLNNSINEAAIQTVFQQFGAVKVRF